jgi:Tol biopolymer transport system component
VNPQYLVGWANNAALSPAEDEIALWGPVDRSAEEREWQLSILNLTSRTEHVIFSIKAHYLDLGGLSWSRDGKKIVFSLPSLDVASVESARYRRNLFTIDVDGSNLSQITSSASDEIWPTWSPDGRYIAFAQGTGEFNRYYLWIMNSDGSCAIQLLEVEGINTPAWSPDGNDIAFEYDGGLYLLDLNNNDILKRMSGLNCGEDGVSTHGVVSQIAARTAGD